MLDVSVASKDDHQGCGCIEHGIDGFAVNVLCLIDRDKGHPVAFIGVFGIILLRPVIIRRFKTIKLIFLTSLSSGSL